MVLTSAARRTGRSDRVDRQERRCGIDRCPAWPGSERAASGCRTSLDMNPELSFRRNKNSRSALHRLFLYFVLCKHLMISFSYEMDELPFGDRSEKGIRGNARTNQLMSGGR
jgi:hypothetical protein